MSLDSNQLRTAMLTVIDGGDAAVRKTARAGARIDAARARARARDAARMAAKPGVAPATVAAAERRATATSMYAAASAALAARSFVTPVAATDETAVVHGRAVGRDRAGEAGLKVMAVDASGAVVAEATTDSRGYYRLDLPTPNNVQPRVKIRVMRANASVHADAAPFAVRGGRSRFREIVVPT